MESKKQNAQKIMSRKLKFEYYKHYLVLIHLKNKVNHLEKRS